MTICFEKGEYLPFVDQMMASFSHQETASFFSVDKNPGKPVNQILMAWIQGNQLLTDGFLQEKKTRFDLHNLIITKIILI